MRFVTQISKVELSRKNTLVVVKVCFIREGKKEKRGSMTFTFIASFAA
jgi:hypothetical protein